ncbi:MAG TPA: hypothetical protein VG895_02460 [Patescibacteria group bacterium]|nr:hypothetical protein [Patescibacteria group bacterium]
MRISLIHGEDTTKAYKKFSELLSQSKKRGFEIIKIKNTREVVSQTLFEDKTVFVLEKPNKVYIKDWKWLKENANKYNSNLLIFFEGNAGVVITKNLPKEAKVEMFELPKNIFLFLDALYPGNSRIALKLFNDTIKTEPTELVFHLMARQLRDLYWAQIGKDEMPLPSWRIEKLSRQAGKFRLENLRRTINKLSDIDIKAKTTEADLKTLLDLFIIEELK